MAKFCVQWYWPRWASRCARRYEGGESRSGHIASHLCQPREPAVASETMLFAKRMGSWPSVQRERGSSLVEEECHLPLSRCPCGVSCQALGEPPRFAGQRQLRLPISLCTLLATGPRPMKQRTAWVSVWGITKYVRLSQRTEKMRNHRCFVPPMGQAPGAGSLYDPSGGRIRSPLAIYSRDKEGGAKTALVPLFVSPNRVVHYEGSTGRMPGAKPASYPSSRPLRRVCAQCPLIPFVNYGHFPRKSPLCFLRG